MATRRSKVFHSKRSDGCTCSTTCHTVLPNHIVHVMNWLSFIIMVARSFVFVRDNLGRLDDLSGGLLSIRRCERGRPIAGDRVKAAGTSAAKKTFFKSLAVRYSSVCARWEAEAWMCAVVGHGSRPHECSSCPWRSALAEENREVLESKIRN
jgi:hypothetical protein